MQNSYLLLTGAESRVTVQCFVWLKNSHQNVKHSLKNCDFKVLIS